MKRESTIVKLLQKLLDLVDEIMLKPLENKKAWTTVNSDLTWLITTGKSIDSVKSRVWLNNTCMGLGRYIDELDQSHITPTHKKDLETILNAITIKAITYISRPKLNPIIRRACGKHENDACVIDSMSNHFLANGVLRQNGWKSMPIFDASCFVMCPKPITLKSRTTIIRVIGKNNVHKGPWWFREALPNNIKEWRSGYAVLARFNLDKEYLHYTISKPTNVWVGTAASQQVWGKDEDDKNKDGKPWASCILKGGNEQIWLDPDDIANLSKPIKTPW